MGLCSQNNYVYVFNLTGYVYESKLVTTKHLFLCITTETQFKTRSLEQGAVVTLHSEALSELQKQLGMTL